MSHLHPNSNILISPPSMYCLTSIQVRSFVSHLHPYNISPTAYSLPFKSWYLHHSFIHVLFHTNPRLDISAWTPSRSRITSIQVPQFVSHIHPSRPSTHPFASQFWPGPIPAPSSSPDVRLTYPVSPPFRFLQLHPPPSPSCLTSIQVMLFISLHHPGRVKSPFRWRGLQLSSIHVLSHPTQVSRYASYPHPYLVSPYPGP